MPQEPILPGLGRVNRGLWLSSDKIGIRTVLAARRAGRA